MKKPNWDAREPACISAMLICSVVPMYPKRLYSYPQQQQFCESLYLEDSSIGMSNLSVAMSSER